ncbi:MAG TPA: RNA-binding protein [Candidatus Caldiarchaeum subterraneum]|uniref:RNA-binding protein n=1 Tax=Caldiarchaeum subterraneum TaxID=311458 RepID=A0A833EAH1_CALS0|nr:RNA-binding protein [Candidatus Caldarchaeum subterraneum]
MYYFSDKEIVVPGQLLTDDPSKSGPGTYVYNGKVYAAQAGLAKLRNGVITIIPVKSPYKPEPGDWVIGVVVDVKPNSVEVDLGGYNFAVIRYSEQMQPPQNVKIGDVVYARVKSSGLKGVLLDADDLRKIEEGIIISISPAHIPRLIGRKGSMINMIKRETGCSITVGRNGLIVVSGPTSEGEFTAISAIRLIASEAHSAGLTDRVAALLKRSKERVSGNDAGEQAG